MNFGCEGSSGGASSSNEYVLPLPAITWPRKILRLTIREDMTDQSDIPRGTTTEPTTFPPFPTDQSEIFFLHFRTTFRTTLLPRGLDNKDEKAEASIQAKAAEVARFFATWRGRLRRSTANSPPGTTTTGICPAISGATQNSPCFECSRWWCSGGDGSGWSR